jgi:hypothetical protein
MHQYQECAHPYAVCISFGLKRAHGYMIFTFAKLGLRYCVLCLIPSCPHHSLPVYLLRFKSAVLNGNLHEKTSISQHLGFIMLTTIILWLLHHVLYELEQPETLSNCLCYQLFRTWVY